MTLRVPLPVRGTDDGAQLRDRFAFYQAFPATLAGELAKEKAMAEERRLNREARLQASWIYGEEQPDV